VQEQSLHFREIMMTGLLILAAGIAALAAPSADRDAVARLDRSYQAAVKRNDAATMERILHSSFLLVLGNGKRIGRKELIEDARSRKFTYELQDEEPKTQSVMVWGDTAIVTAKLRLKGVTGGKPFDRTLWFSDTYVRTERGWKYLFGQASLPLAPQVANELGELDLSEELLAAGFKPVGDGS
jgi:ketosteroid isomerase-like protein